MINFKLGTDSYGRLNFEKLFIATYGFPPQKMGITVKNKIDISKINVTDFHKKFPNCEFIGTNTIFKFENEEFKELTLQEIQEGSDRYVDGDEFSTWVGETRIDHEVTAFFDKCFISIGPYSINCQFGLPKDELYKFITELYNYLPKKIDAPKPTEIDILSYDNGYYNTTKSVNEMHVDVKNQYNDSFEKFDKKVREFLNPDHKQSGILLLNGTAGSGKTSYIRTLITECPNNYVYITPTIASRLSEPDLTSFLLSNENCVFILEDCEEVIMSREDSSVGGAVSGLLNMSDGLMSDIFNGKFICTYNTDDSKVDSALLRKGRCVAHYTFGPLCKEKAINLFAKVHNLSIEDATFYIPDDGMTLADIFHFDFEEDLPKRAKKIGF